MDMQPEQLEGRIANILASAMPHGALYNVKCTIDDITQLTPESRMYMGIIQLQIVSKHAETDASSCGWFISKKGRYVCLSGAQSTRNIIT